MPWEIKEKTFKSFDGVELFYRVWQPQKASVQAIILLHRGHEHSGRLIPLVEKLNLENFWFFAFDLRGHGKSPGERGYADSYAVWIKDLQAFFQEVVKRYGLREENIGIVANSVGAVTAVTWVHDYAPNIRCMALAAPAFRIKLYVPFARPLLRLLRKIKPKSFVTSYVKSRMLTHDVEEAKQYDADPLITRQIAVNILLDLHDTATRIIQDAGAIHTPTLILSAGSDFVVKKSAQRQFFDKLTSAHKEFVEYPTFYHAIFHEKAALDAIAKTRRFIQAHFKQPNDTGWLRYADKAGFTKSEMERLQQPAAFLTSLRFGMQKLSMKTLGKLSDGIRLGWETGFDSGKTLDYVYQNEARGKTFLGKLIDRTYLDAIGWRGIRVRKQHLTELLKIAINQLSMSDIRIMDIAAGGGRYLFEIQQAFPDKNIALLLRDNNATSIAAGKLLAETLQVKNVEFAEHDAFDPASYQLTPAPQIVVASGIYELFPNNDHVLTSLQVIADLLAPGSFFIYTCQPWHPQLEMIARVLSNREGKPWLMRRRTQAEMDELVRSVGLTKIDMRIDDFGIFTVSLAQKPREDIDE